MTGSELVAILPIVVLAAVVVVSMLVVAFFRGHAIAAVVTMFGLIATWLAVPIAQSVRSTPQPVHATALLVQDAFGAYYTHLILAASIVVTALAYLYFRSHDGRREEFYLLLQIATLGSIVLAASDHFATFFLGLEILSVSLYAMIAYPRTEARPLEAGLKYLVLAAASSAVLLFGIALVYASAGTLAFPALGDYLAANAIDVRMSVGFALIIAGFAFKLALVPFHLWTPDIYEGAPAPVTAFLATVSKGGVIAVLFRLFYESGATGAVVTAVSVIAILSMVIGNLLALHQPNLKRLLGYSSIAHFGYVMVAFVAGGERALQAVNFYVAAYFATSLIAFGVITATSTRDRESELIDDYRGLFWRRPWLAAVLTTALLSLAGIPLTAGFFAKFFVVAAGVAAPETALVIVLIIGSAIGLFYYLRVIVAMFESAPEFVSESATAEPRVGFGAGVLLTVLVVVVVWLGVSPGSLLGVLEGASRF